MKSFITLIQGMVMGMAEVIPGVSGSTFALAMGIYEKFIDFLYSVSNVVKEFLKLLVRKTKYKNVNEAFRKLDLRFGFLLVIGMLISIALFSNILSFLLDEYTQLVYAFFFGLVIGSTLIPYEKIESKNFNSFLIIFIASVLTFIVLGIRGAQIEDPSLLYLFGGGIIGISGLLLPGVSGSFILLILGIYEYVIDIVKEMVRFNITSDHLIDLLVFILGLVTGFTLFVRLLKYFFENYKNILLAIITGVLIGSLRVINPFNPFIENTSSEVIVLLLIFIGLLLVQGLNKFSNK